MKLILVVLAVICSVGVAQAQDLVEYTFRVEGTCNMCKQRIEKIAKGDGQAKSAKWNVDTKLLTIQIDESVTSASAVKYYLAQQGHDNGSFLATDEVYDNLHACCKYREETEAAVDNPSHLPQSNSQSEIKSDNSLIENIEGHIYAMENGNKTPLTGANIIFLGATEGTNTNIEGYFSLANKGQHDSIRISYIGYEDHVIKLEDNYIDITLADGHELETIEISYRRKTTEVSFVNTINVVEITREELCKAACCNLSESFETNPSVDVSFSDAVTGTKQIQMLGLAGPYVQISRELLPDVRGMNTIYGLTATPGAWIQSIQLIKGTGSVVNGFESFTGQINVELKKPTRDEILHINGFANNGGRLELNANYRTDVSKNISTGLLLHGKKMPHAHDNNGDGFTDMPTEEDFVIANRWKFKRRKNIEGQIGFKYADFNHAGGFHDHFTGASQDHENHWRMATKTRRAEVWTKTGYIFPDNPERSIGLQLAGTYHEQNAEYGFQRYNTNEKTFYSNLIFQNIFSNGHVLRTGLTYQMDDVDELVDKSGIYKRKESVPGAYAEYTWKSGDKWAIIPGLRVDHHNNYGSFVTPRVHAKYNVSDKSIVRFTAGRGQRTANIFAENMGIFAGNRSVRIIGGDPAVTPYGLDAEVAWNYGINFTQGFRVAERELVFAIDAYKTDFENQIIADFETSGAVTFYNLNGKSYSNSVQVKLDYEVAKNLDMRIAYRLFDVMTTYEGVERERPYVSKHRAFVNAAYKTENGWHFDSTVSWRGAQRLPSTANNPVQYRRPDNSPSYFLAGGQISKRWGNKWDVYVGGENIFNYQQKDAIIAADDALDSPFFDASIVWAPLFGANFYVGFRFNLAESAN